MKTVFIFENSFYFAPTKCFWEKARKRTPGVGEEFEDRKKESQDLERAQGEDVKFEKRTYG